MRNCLNKHKFKIIEIEIPKNGEIEYNLKAIKSFYNLKELFSFLNVNLKLEIIIYNKQLQREI